MQKVLTVYRSTSDGSLNFNSLSKELAEGWKVISSENILSASNKGSQYSTASEFNYTSEIVYILEK